MLDYLYNNANSLFWIIGGGLFLLFILFAIDIYRDIDSAMKDMD